MNGTLLSERTSTSICHDNWDSFTVEQWRAAAYDGDFFDDFTTDSVDFVARLAKNCRAEGSDTVSLIDIGY